LLIAAFLAPLAGRGRLAPSENQNSARWGRFHKLRIAEGPPHPDLLPACGEKETTVHPGQVLA